LHLKIFVMHARAQPEGRGFTGAQDYDRFVAGVHALERLPAAAVMPRSA
jgi:hypothetical protein